MEEKSTKNLIIYGTAMVTIGVFGLMFANTLKKRTQLKPTPKSNPISLPLSPPTSPSHPNPSPSLSHKIPHQNSSEENYEKLTQRILTKSQLLCEKFSFEQSGDLLTLLIDTLPPSLPNFHSILLKLCKLSSQSYLKANKVEKSEIIFSNLYPTFFFVKEKNLFYFLEFLQIRADCFLRLDNRFCELSFGETLLGKFNQISPNDLLPFAEKFLIYGRIMRKKGKYDQAIKSINQSLQIFLKMGNSIKQLFPIFIELSSAHLLNGDYQKSKEIYKYFKSQFDKSDQENDQENILLFKYKYGELLFQSKFYSQSEKIISKIIYSFSPHLEVVKASTTLLANILYNSGKKEDSFLVFDKIRKEKIDYLISSKYFTINYANILFRSKDNFNTGRLSISIDLNSSVKVGNLVLFQRLENNGIDIVDFVSFEIREEDLLRGLVFRSEEEKNKRFCKGLYEVQIRLYSDKSKSHLLFTHFQFIYCEK